MISHQQRRYYALRNAFAIPTSTDDEYINYLPYTCYTRSNKQQIIQNAYSAIFPFTKPGSEARSLHF